MSDESLIRAIQALDRPVDVDPAFDARLLALLEREYAGRRRIPSRAVLLLVAALLLALVTGAVIATGSGLRLPWTVDSWRTDVAAVDPCQLLLADRYPPQDADEAAFQEEFELHDTSEYRWCRWPRWYEGWSGFAIPHVFVRTQATATADAALLIPTLDEVLRSHCRGTPCQDAGSVGTGSWEWSAGPGAAWEATIRAGENHGGVFAAVAVSIEPYFYLVTARDPRDAYQLAAAVASELGQPEAAEELEGAEP